MPAIVVGLNQFTHCWIFSYQNNSTQFTVKACEALASPLFRVIQFIIYYAENNGMTQNKDISWTKTDFRSSEPFLMHLLSSWSEKVISWSFFISAPVIC